jgi:hypothetical protein
MDRAFLEQLGLEVTEAQGVVEAQLQLTSGQAINPLTRVSIERVAFTVLGDRLLYVGPPEFVGAQPINLAFLTSATRLEDLVIGTLNDHLYQLERRSSELAALGVSPRVDPVTLQLTAEVEVGPMRLTIGPTRAGQFRVVKARREGAELTTGGATTFFELSEFRDRKALGDFLFAMYGDVSELQRSAPAHPRLTPEPEGAGPGQSIPFRDLIHAFGDAVLPPRSSLEVLATVRVGQQQLRFAAARVQGQTFRGLLAGASGKVWADRFELGDFPGIRALVASVLQAPIEEIEVSVP